MKKCPKCNTIWFYISDGDYYSNYERYGYKLNCNCGYAWAALEWCGTKEELIRKWENINEDNKDTL